MWLSYLFCALFALISRLEIKNNPDVAINNSEALKVMDSFALFNQMVGIYLAKTLISDIEKVKFTY